MKLTLTKEKKDMYYIQLSEGRKILAYTQGSTPQEALINIVDAYELVKEHENEKRKNQTHQLFRLNTLAPHLFQSHSFKSLSIAI